MFLSPPSSLSNKQTKSTKTFFKMTQISQSAFVYRICVRPYALRNRQRHVNSVADDAQIMLTPSPQLGDFYWGQSETSNQASKYTVQIQEGYSDWPPGSNLPRQSCNLLSSGESRRLSFFIPGLVFSNQEGNEQKIWSTLASIIKYKRARILRVKT